MNVAPSKYSGTGAGLPFVTSTQNGVSLVGVLEDPHPVWKPSRTLDAVPVMLYMAVKRRPVVGLGVFGWPKAEVAASSRVSAVSAELHEAPLTRMPPRHSATTTGVPNKTVPVKSMATGRRIVWSAKSTISKPLSPPDSWVNTETLS